MIKMCNDFDNILGTKNIKIKVTLIISEFILFFVLMYSAVMKVNSFYSDSLIGILIGLYVLVIIILDNVFDKNSYYKFKYYNVNIRKLYFYLCKIFYNKLFIFSSLILLFIYLVISLYFSFFSINIVLLSVLFLSIIIPFFASINLIACIPTNSFRYFILKIIYVYIIYGVLLMFFIMYERYNYLTLITYFITMILLTYVQNYLYNYIINRNNL